MPRRQERPRLVQPAAEEPIALTVRKRWIPLTRVKRRHAPDARDTQPDPPRLRPLLPLTTRTQPWERWPDLVRVSAGSDHNFFAGFTRSVGESGLFVATYRAVSLGEVMLIRFTLPGAPEGIGAVCEARWVREFSDRTIDVVPGAGFQFTRIDAEAMAAVLRFMDHREPIFWEG